MKMKKRCALTSFFIILLIANSLAAAIEIKPENKNSITPAVKVIAAGDNGKLKKTKQNSSYDGLSSASKLRAKRSHSVSKEDEAGLSIFLGLIVIGIIVFFVTQFGEKK